MRRPKLTYANVVSTLALFLAMGGVSYAVGIPRDSVGTSQLKDKNVLTADLRDKQVSSGKLADKAVTISKLDSAVTSLIGGRSKADVITVSFDLDLKRFLETSREWDGPAYTVYLVPNSVANLSIAGATAANSGVVDATAADLARTPGGRLAVITLSRPNNGCTLVPADDPTGYYRDWEEQTNSGGTPRWDPPPGSINSTNFPDLGRDSAGRLTVNVRGIFKGGWWKTDRVNAQFPADAIYTGKFRLFITCFPV